MDTVIVYGTHYGTSLKVAQVLGEQIAGAVELVDAKNIENIDLDKVDKLIIGCGIKVGNIPNELKTWVEKEQDNIIKKELYIYMCAGERDESKIKELFSNNFPVKIINSSRFSTCVGGEVNLDKLSFFTKVVFGIAKKFNPGIDNLSEEKITNLAKEINKLKVDF